MMVVRAEGVGLWMGEIMFESRTKLVEWLKDDEERCLGLVFNG
jgi:hypothetical protein